MHRIIEAVKDEQTRVGRLFAPCLSQQNRLFERPATTTRCSDYFTAFFPAKFTESLVVDNLNESRKLTSEAALAFGKKISSKVNDSSSDLRLHNFMSMVFDNYAVGRSLKVGSTGD
jgi:hypothetical protein